ncbi:MAG TPA: DNA methyltransferase [Candidatus Saccharimonadales bacterium]|jgi:hypothetical protein|nr:DNA methyltransferase [Candidatus Saccharimonadales bacterium]
MIPTVENLIDASVESTGAPTKPPPSAQAHTDDAVHRWYRLRLGFSDHLVASLLEEMTVKTDQVVLDPFCGAGTTLVECKKRGIRSVGVDANPSSCFAAGVKTNWNLSRQRVQDLLEELESRFYTQRLDTKGLIEDPTICYLKKAGLLKRGWICDQPLLEAVALKRNILRLKTSRAYRDFLTLALLSEIIEGAANIKFGPELYCGPKRGNAEVFEGFVDRVFSMLDDIDVIGACKADATIYQGDSRDLSLVMSSKVHAIICSPPYPAEHDYTRNSRLELAFLEEVGHRGDLQRIKKTMLRCHTKGIYAQDTDETFLGSHPMLTRIVQEIEKRAVAKTHGFARLYGRVVKEYFGGMVRHLMSAHDVLLEGGKCAYVVGDQSAYLQVPIPTAEILAALAVPIGFTCLGIRKWRTRWSSTTKKAIAENILLLQKQGAKPYPC